MNKKFVISIVVVIIILTSVGIAWGKHGVKTPTISENVATSTSEQSDPINDYPIDSKGEYGLACFGADASPSYSNGTVTIKARFDSCAKTVTFSGTSLGTTTLPQTTSASGIRYANADESTIFWEHQGQVTITSNNATLFQGQKLIGTSSE